MAKKDSTGGDGRTLTTRQGHPVTNNQSQRTVGSRGPATLENYHFLEKISHFDRERIPERVVHARGFVCYGEFEATGQIGDEHGVVCRIEYRDWHDRARRLRDLGGPPVVLR